MSPIKKQRQIARQNRTRLEYAWSHLTPLQRIDLASITLHYKVWFELYIIATSVRNKYRRYKIERTLARLYPFPAHWLE